MDIKDLRKRFVWTRDGFDSYRILKARFGPLEGDCDDFAATSLWIAEGKSMMRFWLAVLTFRAVFWAVKGEGWASHVVLYHRDFGWIDNQSPAWGRKRHTLRYPVPFFMVAIKMLAGKVKR